MTHCASHRNALARAPLRWFKHPSETRRVAQLLLAWLTLRSDVKTAAILRMPPTQGHGANHKVTVLGLAASTTVNGVPRDRLRRLEFDSRPEKGSAEPNNVIHTPQGCQRCRTRILKSFQALFLSKQTWRWGPKKKARIFFLGRLAKRECIRRRLTPRTPALAPDSLNPATPTLTGAPPPRIAPHRSSGARRHSRRRRRALTG